MTSLKTSIKIITYLSDIGCLEIQGASLGFMREKILKGAVELFLERGIDKVSTRDLTEYLGI